VKERTRRRLHRLVSLFPDGVIRSIIYFLGLALTAQLLHAVIERPRDEELPVREPAIQLADNPIPSPSGAHNTYPLNPMIDGDVKTVGNPIPNADLQQPSFNTGTPATNADLEIAPVGVVTVPNGAFGSGDFTDWTQGGTGITIQSDASHTNWAKFTSTTGSLTTSAFTIPDTAQELVYDINYISTTGYSGLEIYVLTGADYSTSTLLKTDKEYRNGTWSTSFINVVAYRSTSVKFKFQAKNVPVGLDNVEVQQVFPGWDITDSPMRKTEAGGNDFAEVSGALTSSVFTVDADAQYLSFRARAAGSSSNWKAYIAEGPTFDTFTQVASGGTGTTWGLARIAVGGYVGEQIKVRISKWLNNTQIDDIGLMRVEIPQFSINDEAVLVDDGAGNTYAKYHGAGLTTEPITLPADVQNLLIRSRTDPNSGVYQNVDLSVTVLSGPTFAQSTTTGSLDTSNDWDTYRFGLGAWAGQTVKLRIASGSGTLNVDDLGPLEQVLPGWTNTSKAIHVDQDANGTYVEGAYGSATLRSSWIETGLIGATRSYRVGFVVAVCSACTIQANWTNEAGQSWVVMSTSIPQGVYREGRISVHDFMGSRGYFTIALINGTGSRLYLFGDNVARQQLSEPFSRKVGMGIDTTTGAVQFAENDMTLPGPIPITFTRYYNSHSDLLGSLGYRWSSTFDTRIEFDGSNAAVVFGSGREEYFDESVGDYTPVDLRVHSTLVEEADGTFTYTTKDGTEYLFTAAGALTAIVDLNGNQLALGRDGQGRLTSVTGAGGTAITLGYDAADRLATVTDPEGATTTYGYNANDDLVTVTDAAGGVRTYTYAGHLLDTVRDGNDDLVVDNGFDGVFRLSEQTDAADQTISVAYDTPGKGATRITDPEGGQATYYFDRSGRTTAAVDPTGAVISYLFDAIGTLDRVIDPAANEWNFAFDSEGDLTSGNDPLGNPTSFTWNPQHLPTTVTDARGNTTTYTYDANGNMTSVTDQLDHTTTYTYDTSGNLLTETDPEGGLTTYAYDSRGNRLTKTDPRNKTWTWTYSAANRMITETDPLDHTTTYGYDQLGRLDEITDHLGNETTLDFDFPGYLKKHTNPLGKITTWTYNDRGLVVTKTDARGKVTTYGHDANRNMTSITDPNGNTTTYAYDDANRLVSVTNELDEATSYTYDGAGRLATVTDPLDRVTSYAYDDAGRLTTTTLPNNGTVIRAYDANGNLTSLTDPLENVTTSVYDDANRLTSVTNALDEVTTYDYDDANRLLLITDPLSHTTSYGYDAAGNRTSVTDALNHTTAYAFDDAGRLSSITDPTNRVTSYGYDSVDRLTSVTAPGGGVTSYGYDADDRLTSVTSPTDGVTTYTYGPTDLLLTETDPLDNTTAYTYDGAGRQLTVTDPLNHITTYGYDDANRMTSITDALSGVVTFGYDAAGQQTSLTDQRNETWNYGYNALGRKTSETDPLDRETIWTYNAEGATTSQTDARDITTSYGYDDVGRLTSVTYPGGSNGYVYDDAGRRTSMTDPNGTTTWGYDAAGRITSVAQPAGTLTYGYDDAGRRTSMTLPGSRDITYGYDTAGLLDTVTDWGGRWASFTYDDAGRRETASRSNGVTSSYAYDDAGQVESIVHAAGGTTLQSFTYTYDDAGNRTGLTSPQGNETYTYDALDRLTDVSYAGGPTVEYGYDAAGNRTSETRGGQTTNYTHDDAGQLTQVGAETYTYDAAGNLMDAGSDSYEWDHGNRLTSVSKDGHSATYVYDGAGVRTGSNVDSDADALLVDRVGGLPTVVDDGERAYVHAGGLAWQTSASTSEFALQDGLGSVRGLTGSSGTLAGSASFESFGAPRSSSGSSSLFGFTGEPTDATGLVDLRARALEPGIGRFLSVDTVRPNAPGGQGFNLYSYVANNPATWVDPTGHSQASSVLTGLTLLEMLDFILWEAELAAPGLLVCSLGCLLITIVIVAAFLVLACALIDGCLRWLAGGGSHGNPRPEPQTDPEHADSGHPSPVPQPQPGGGGDEGEGKQGTRTCDDPPADDGNLRHYTTNTARELIESSGELQPSDITGRLYLTSTVYSSGVLAKSELALRSLPDGYYEVPRERIGELHGPGCVSSDNGEDGGGIEYWTPEAIDATGLRWVPISP
jgi:RHS repeat-associated protein